MKPLKLQTKQLTINQTNLKKLKMENLLKFENQLASAKECNKLMDIANKLKEQGKASIALKPSSINRYGEDLIGIRLNNSSQWYWFELDFNYDWVRLFERYSTNTGKSSRGFNIGFNFLSKIGLYK